VAQRWLVYKLTGSTAMLGIVNALGSLPAAALAPVSGAVADRVEKRRILIWSQIAPTLLALALWSLTATHWVRVWHVVALSLVLGVVRAFEIPTRQSLWAELVPKRDLMSAIVLNTASVNLTRILGPAVAGVLIAAVSLEHCFLLNALSFLAPLWVLWRMPPTPVAPRGKESFWQSFRDGLAYVRADPHMRRLLPLVGAWSLFASQFDVVLPEIADKVFRVGATGYGFMTAVLGTGALVGAFAAASLEHLGRRGHQVILSSFVAAAALGSLAFVHSFGLALVSLFVLGVGMVMQNTTANTLVQTIVPDGLRGRVMGVYSFMFIGMMPLGNLFYAAMAKAFGAPRALLVGALSFGVAAFALLVPNSAVRRLK
jgi:MFS family permease